MIKGKAGARKRRPVVSPWGRGCLLVLVGPLGDVAGALPNGGADVIVLELGLIGQLAQGRRHVELVVRQALLDGVEPFGVVDDHLAGPGDHGVLHGVVRGDHVDQLLEVSDPGTFTRLLLLVELGVDRFVQGRLVAVEVVRVVGPDTVVEVPALLQEVGLAGVVAPLVDALVVGHGVGADLGGPGLLQLALGGLGHLGQLRIRGVLVEGGLGLGRLAVLHQRQDLGLLLVGERSLGDVRDGQGQGQVGGQGDQGDQGSDQGHLLHGLLPPRAFVALALNSSVEPK
ncbi:hypothetical protein C0580_01430 [Candidatus Parcubacteria bacterium]|nr:MAG: hypothetical protein C0580_01430 [Candidatus Parcubacteria bacterium]